jgi:hypothetical protein
VPQIVRAVGCELDDGGEYERPTTPTRLTAMPSIERALSHPERVESYATLPRRLTDGLLVSWAGVIARGCPSGSVVRTPLLHFGLATTAPTRNVACRVR